MAIELARDETILAEITIPAAVFAKSTFVLTNKRVVARVRKTFLGLFGVGTAESTYPLTNVASVSVGSAFRFWALIFALVLVLIGLAELAHGWGIIVLLFGLWEGLAAFPGAIAVTNNAGQKMSHGVWITGRQAAATFAARVNTAVAERL